MRTLDFKLTGYRDGQTYIVDAFDVVYIDTADKRTFLYIATEVFESDLRLYELEEQLSKADFFRASKSRKTAGVKAICSIHQS